MKRKIVFLVAVLLLMSGCSSNEPSDLDKIIGDLSTSYLEGQGSAETTTEVTKPEPFTNAVTGIVSGYFGGTFMLTDATGKIYNVNAATAVIYGANEITDGLTAIVSFTDDSSGSSSITAISVTVISDLPNEPEITVAEETVAPEMTEISADEALTSDETSETSNDSLTSETEESSADSTSGETTVSD